MAKKKQEEPKMVEQVRRVFQDSGLTLQDLADRSGVNQSQLSRFFRGERTLTFPAAARVCEALGLELRPVGETARPKKRKKK